MLCDGQQRRTGLLEISISPVCMRLLPPAPVVRQQGGRCDHRQHTAHDPVNLGEYIVDLQDPLENESNRNVAIDAPCSSRTACRNECFFPPVLTNSQKPTPPHQREYKGIDHTVRIHAKAESFIDPSEGQTEQGDRQIALLNARGQKKVEPKAQWLSAQPMMDE